MLSLQDCLAMTDIPKHKILELANSEHEPVMLAVALAAQRGARVGLPSRREADAGSWRRTPMPRIPGQPDGP